MSGAREISRFEMSNVANELGCSPRSNRRALYCWAVRSCCANSVVFQCPKPVVGSPEVQIRLLTSRIETFGAAFGGRHGMLGMASELF